MALTQIEQGMLKDGILTADTAGRLKMADGFVNDAKINGVAASKISGQLADGNMSPGSVIQVVQTSNSTTTSTNSSSWVATGLSASITPLSSSSRILVTCSGNWNPQTNAAGPSGVSVFRNGTNLGHSQYGLTWVYMSLGTDIHFPTTVNIVDSPASASAITYDIRVNSNYGGAGNIRWNYAGTPIYLILMEIAA